MNSFHFLKKYYEGEYEKYSPFLSLIFNKLLEYRFTIVCINKFEFELLSQKGDKVVYLILDKDEKEIYGNYIKLNGLQAVFGSKKERIVIDHVDSFKVIQTKVNLFFRRLEEKKEESFSSMFYKEFKIYQENISKSIGIIRSLKNLNNYFRNTIQKEYRTGLFLKWIFAHKVLVEILSVKKVYLDLLEKNPIFNLFNKALHLIEKEIDVISQETLSILKAKIPSTDYHQFLIYISEDLKKAIEWNNKEDTLSNKDIYLSRYYFSEEILNTILKKQNIGLSVSIGLDLIEYILETSKVNTKYTILCESIGDYYLSLCLLKWNQLNTSAKLSFLDLSTIILPKESTQKAIFHEKNSDIPFNSLKNIETFVYDFGRYVDNTAINERTKTRKKNGKKLDSSLNSIISILKNTPQKSKCLALFNNHLVYNSQFKNLRSLISKNYSGQLKELSIKQPLSPLILSLENRSSKNGLQHIQLDEAGAWSEKGVLIDEGGDWFKFFQKNTLPLFSKSNSIFSRSYKALFNKEKRMPVFDYQKEKDSICIIKKPFSENVFVSKSVLYEAIESYDNQFYENNIFLCLGYENSHRNKLLIASNYYPTYHFLEKLKCFPLLNKNSAEINITDYAYTFFRQKLIQSLEEKNLNNIEGKDKQLKFQISKLKKLTLSLPVLHKFSQQVEELFELNKKENVSKVNIRYYHILNSLKGKIGILKRGAKERKRLLNTIENELGILEHMLRTFIIEESNCYKELGFLTKENIFNYTLAVTNSKMYNQKFGYQLVYDEPVLPFLPNMWEWIFYGKRLLDSFNGNVENELKFTIKKISDNSIEQPLEKIQVVKKIGSILINNEIEITDLPPMVWEYTINEKSPVEWKVAELRKRFRGTKLDDSLKDKIVDEVIRSCNTAVQIIQIINKINQLDFKLTN